MLRALRQRARRSNGLVRSTDGYGATAGAVEVRGDGARGLVDRGAGRVVREAVTVGDGRGLGLGGFFRGLAAALGRLC